MIRAATAAIGAATSGSNGSGNGGLPELILWPSDANFIDVTQSPYNADPTGVVDATSAIQAALNAAATGTFNAGTVYLPQQPNGDPAVYKVSDTIRPVTAGARLCGAGVGRTIIRLADSSPGFQSGNKAVYAPGYGFSNRANSSFANHVQHLTIEIGSGNGAAVAMEANMCNTGAIEHVRLYAPSGARWGLWIQSSTGNAYAQDVEIDGFTRGIRGDLNLANNFILEDITIKNCTTAIWNEQKNLWFVDLTVQNCPKVLDSRQSVAVTGIVNGTFTGGSGGAALDLATKGFLYVRNISATGWDRIIEVGAAQHFVGKMAIVEWASENYFVGETETAWDENLAAPVSLNLPIEKYPEYHTNDFSKWARVGPGSGDRTADIQAAIDSGAEIVYCAYGGGTAYTISGTVIVRGACRKLDFMFSLVTGSGLIRVDDGTAPEVIIQNMDNDGPGITKNTSRPVSVAHGRIRTTISSSASASGKFFVTNIGPHVVLLVQGSNVEAWGRQLDHGSIGDRLEVNAATLWLLGDNAEPPAQNFAPVEVVNGGIMEVIGGAADAKEHVFDLADGAYFRADDSYMSCIIAGHYRDIGSGNGRWQHLVNDNFGANLSQIFDSELLLIDTGTFARLVFPLYVSPQWPPG